MQEVPDKLYVPAVLDQLNVHAYMMYKISSSFFSLLIHSCLRSVVHLVNQIVKCTSQQLRSLSYACFSEAFHSRCCFPMCSHSALMRNCHCTISQTELGGCAEKHDGD